MSDDVTEIERLAIPSVHVEGRKPDFRGKMVAFRTAISGGLKLCVSHCTMKSSKRASFLVSFVNRYDTD